MLIIPEIPSLIKVTGISQPLPAMTINAGMNSLSGMDREAGCRLIPHAALL